MRPTCFDTGVPLKISAQMSSHAVVKTNNLIRPFQQNPVRREAATWSSVYIISGGEKSCTQCALGCTVPTMAKLASSVRLSEWNLSHAASTRRANSTRLAWILSYKSLCVPHAASTRRGQERVHPCIVPRVSTRYTPCAPTNKNTK